MDSWLHPLTRFLHYALLLGLFGATAFRCIGLRRVRDNGAGVPATLVVCGALAPLVSVLLMLVAVGAMMGQPFWAVDASVVRSLVTTTSFGTAFLVRAVLLSLGFAALLVGRRMAIARPAAALLYGSALATLPWSGHAAAGEGVAGLAHRLNDAVHLLAAGLWIGAIGWFTVLAARAHRLPRQVDAEAVLAAMHRFAPLGVGLVALVSVTGVINAQLIFGLGNSATVLGTTYGQLLVIKIGLVGIMLLCASRHAAPACRYRQPAIISPTGDAATLAALRGSLAAELAVALLVIGVAAFLGLASPMS